jgi:peptide/nickel transport system permease protein
MEWVILWTDALILLLAAVVLLMVTRIARHAHLRVPWRQVFQRPLAMAAGVLLAAYVLVGLVDSAHLRLALPEPDNQGQTIYGGEVLSLLDLVLQPLRDGVETSYSAPLAAFGFNKKASYGEQGHIHHDYPRLKYGGAHLDDPENDRLADLLSRTGAAAGAALALWLLAGGLFGWRMARRHRRGVLPAIRQTLIGGWSIPWHIALAVIGVLAWVVALVWLLAPHYHLMGTDKVGQDVFYQAVKSIRTGLVIGTLTTVVMLPFALWLGIAAGYFRGWVDDVVQYVYTTLSSIPGVLLIASAVLLLQVFIARNPEMFDNLAARADMRLLFLCVILGVTSWTSLCRLLRAETLKLRDIEYVQAAHAFGVGHGRIIQRHILPYVMHIIIITVVLDFSSLVLAEAVLAYIEVGVDPTTPSWGNMINASRLEMAREPVVWWPLVAAFQFMFVLVLSANLFADAVRDAFDPRTAAKD